MKSALPVCKLRFSRKCHFLHFSNVFVIFLHFFTFENFLKILVLWVLIWSFLLFYLSTQRTILPIFKSFGVRLSILVGIPYVMPISLELVYFGAWLEKTQVNYNPLTLRLIGHSTEEVGILGIHPWMLNIQWLFLTLLIFIILCILSILFILNILIFILITWLNLLHFMRGPWVSSLHQSSLMIVYAFNT